MIRKPAVSGQFYPANKDEINSLLHQFIDNQAVKHETVGLVLPHAGYVYSGAVAGATISRIRLRQTAVILGPNHTGMGKPFAIMTEGSWQTPLGEVEVASTLARHILSLSRYLEDDTIAHRYEHSIEVQLPFLQYFDPDIKIVPITLTGSSISAYKEIGWAIAKAIQDTGASAFIIASSDMTHYEPHDKASEKDKKAIEAILALDEDELIQTITNHKITMCGYGPVACLIRASKELGANQAELVKYQTSGDACGDYSSVVGYAGIIIKAKQLHPLVDLAKRAVETYVREHKTIKPPVELTAEMKEKAGVFVSLHKGRELRGCIGTFSPAHHNIAEEVIDNAINSATQDPRFSPVSPYELTDLSYSVDVLSKPEAVADKTGLDPIRYGVIVEAGYRRGLLLPDLEGVDTAEKQIEICRMKAGINPGEKVKLYRFEVKRYK